MPKSAEFTREPTNASAATDTRISRMPVYQGHPLYEWLPLVLICALSLWRFLLAVSLPYERLVARFDDDAFYYFTIARNLAEGLGSTFNGIDPTNGYHPVWLAAVTPIFAVFEGRSALVAVTALQCCIFISFGYVLTRIARAIGDTPAVLVAATPIIIVGVAGPSLFFSGMETGLLILALSLLGLLYIRTDGYSTDAATWKNSVITGVIMTFAVGSRLDSIPILLLVGCVIAVRWRAHRHLVFVTALVPAAFILVYLVLNAALFHSATPVSGRAKALGEGTNLSAIAQFISAPTIFGISLYLGAVALVAIPVCVLFARRGDRTRRASAEFGAAVLAGSVLVILYYALASSWNLWPWYFYGAPIALMFCLPAVVAHLGRKPRIVSSVLAVIAIVGVAVLMTAVSAVLPISRDPYISAAPDVAETVDNLAVDGGPIAVGDRAGSFAFHLARPTIQLEGLVNSSDYLWALSNGGVNQFLNDRATALYARIDADPGQPVDGLPDCRKYPEPAQGSGPKANIVACSADLLVNIDLSDGTSFRVWRFRTDLNAEPAGPLVGE